MLTAIGHDLISMWYKNGIKISACSFLKFASKKITEFKFLNKGTKIRLNMSSAGSVISFHDIHYTVEVRPAGKLCGKKEPKEIIKGVK